MQKQKQIQLALFFILIPFMGMGQHFLDDDITDEGESDIHYGRWIKLENPVNEFPICYQLWSCDKSHLEDDTILKNRLPKGEWGICENYLDPNPDHPDFCSRCDVAPPQDLCY